MPKSRTGWEGGWLTQDAKALLQEKAQGAEGGKEKEIRRTGRGTGRIEETARLSRVVDGLG